MFAFIHQDTQEFVAWPREQAIPFACVRSSDLAPLDPTAESLACLGDTLRLALQDRDDGSV